MPVSVSGYNIDAVVENEVTSTYSNYANPVDVANYALYEYGLNSTTQGLPSDGIISDDTYTFQLSDYGNGTGYSNNALKATGVSSTGTLTLDTPGYYSSLSFLVFATDTSCDVTFDVLLASTASVSLQTTVKDWYNSSGFIVKGLGRTRVTTDEIQTNTDNPRMYVVTVDLTGTDSEVVSTTFTNESTGSLLVMGVSGVAVPEPHTYVAAMGVLSIGLIFLRRWRR